MAHGEGTGVVENICGVCLKPIVGSANTDRYSFGEHDECRSVFNRDDLSQARTQAIDDCIKVVRELEGKWSVEGRSAYLGDRHGDATRFRHIEAAACQVASRLEALKDTAK